MRTLRFVLGASLVLAACGPTVGAVPDAEGDAMVGAEAAVVDAEAGAPVDVTPLDVVEPVEAGALEAGPEAGEAEGGMARDGGGDAADPFADAGALGPPAWVPVTVETNGSCPALTPCGGNVPGTWDVAAVCVEVPISRTLALCPGARVTRADGQARGRVIFGTAPAIARRVAQSNVQVDIYVPAACARLTGGCAGLQDLLRASVPDSTCAMNPSGECRCTSRVSSTIDDGDLYETRDNHIVSSSSGKRWGYCVNGTDLRYDDRSSSGPREPGVVTLRRRE